MRPPFPSSTRRSARGASLLEALIAFVVLSVGVLAVGRLQTQLRLGSDIARQRSEAVRLGQEDLETQRTFSSLAASAGARSFAEIASAAVAVDPDTGYATNTRYRLTREVRTATAIDAKEASVTVAWADRTGEAQRIVLSSIIAGHDQVHAAALRIPPAGLPVVGALGRSAWIPLASKNLGDGRSALKPARSGTTAFVFDNASGLVTAVCSGVAAATATADLTAAALVGCDSGTGYLLSGTVRFSLATPPDPVRADDAPLDLAVALTLAGGPYPIAPVCVAGAVAGADRHVAYHCVVRPLASGAWSGRSRLVPIGWGIGSGPRELRVCRFAADADGSGAVDANIEHPADYRAANGPLAQQNFLVVAGSQACPAASPVRIAGTTGDVFADRSTAAHQP